MARTGVVVIGRNEGERLVRCLRSVVGSADAVVYVDSGSTDRSVEAARELGVGVVTLDRSVPFTAARGRNAGFRHLLTTLPDLERVQFVDGDCEVDPGWFAAAHAAMDADPKAAVVCGRRRERHPERSAYNRLCDLEWDTPVGEATACGGDALMRVGPLRDAGGFRESLIAGEEPELCARLRAAGWKVFRLPAEMTRHDAAMTRFGQWWRRTVRAGHAYAEVSALHGRTPDRTWVRERRSNWFWGVVLPVVAALGAMVHPAALVLFAGYPVLGLRAYRSRRRRGTTPADARLYAAFCVLAKFPMALGQAQYLVNRLRGRRAALIEYKHAGPDGGRPRVGYLVNQYPHVSHSFIRREIRGLERLGVEVVRVSVRPPVAVVDPDDRAEIGRTWVLLDRGLTGLAVATLAVAVTRPLRLMRALRVAARLGRRSGKRLRTLVYLAEACRLVRRLRRERVTHLHAHFGTNPADVALLTRVLGGPPFSFTVHGPEEFDRPDALSLGDKIAAAAFVVGVSSFGRSQLLRWARPADWPRVHVVRCGVDAAFLRGGPQPPAAVPRLVCVGRLAEQKGQLVLVEAAAKLAADGLDFDLVLAGDGPMRPEIEAAVAAHGLTGRVRITGWLSNDAVRAELAAARLMVLPSFAEGLPVVLMEALALGRPVVTTYVAGIPELVRHGENGWLVPAGDPDALAAALADGLRADPDRLAAMGRAGAAAAAAMHDADQEAGKLAALFAGAVARGVS
jgi:glycosyltransferase involved in cell wall biosynthesis/GT2 family glycosyltransferase